MSRAGKYFSKAGLTRGWFVIVFSVVWLGSNIFMFTRFSQQEHNDAVKIYGDVAQFAIPAAGLVGSLAIGDVTGASQFAWGCIANLGATTILKQSIDTTRPNGLPHSFPSGHTAFAFQGAVYITRRFSWKLGVFAIILACLVGLSRIDAKMHYPRDVIAGAVIGTACSLIFTRPRKEEGIPLPPAGQM